MSKLDPKILETYQVQGKIIKRTYKKGVLVHNEGDPCQQVEIIQKGQVQVERIDTSGHLMTIKTFTPGDIIGGNLIFSSQPTYPLTITSLTDLEVYIISKASLEDLCDTHKDFMLAFIQIISDQSKYIVTRMKNRTSRTIRQSLLGYIYSQYQAQGQNPIRLTMTKKALAEHFGVSRTSLSRQLQLMKQEGIITYDAKLIHILDFSFITSL